uniref:Uncharacterized protein n=1 Tax=Rhipicephalus microplus TaxID=6941 RepID=A0A6G5AET7_RHIMP
MKKMHKVADSLQRCECSHCRSFCFKTSMTKSVCCVSATGQHQGTKDNINGLQFFLKTCTTNRRANGYATWKAQSNQHFLQELNALHKVQALPMVSKISRSAICQAQSKKIPVVSNCTTSFNI